MAQTPSNLAAEYQELAPLAQDFADELHRQISSLLTQNGIRLGVPIEKRVKTWESISEKLERKTLQVISCKELPDFVGLRVILLFHRDAIRTCELVEKHFTVLQQEDKRAVLEDSRFGYASFHYVVSAPAVWQAVPTLSGVTNFRAEIQVRTLAQHIWAAASHTLQYKQEQHVPAAVRRTINRVAALLETVDLEFERVLTERQSYREEAHLETQPGTLNADLVSKLLDEVLPPQNKSETEMYSVLIDELRAFGINSLSGLRSLLQRHIPVILEVDRRRVETEKQKPVPLGTTPDRIAKGVFFSHVGLARRALSQEFGARYEAHLARRAQAQANPQ
jgi:putative GTP pyrophosphokinase